MQMDYKIDAVRPAHSVKQLRIKVDGEEILSAETGISVSEDQSFTFFVRPRDGGTLTAEVTDPKGRQWTQTLERVNGGGGPCRGRRKPRRGQKKGRLAAPLFCHRLAQAFARSLATLLPPTRSLKFGHTFSVSSFRLFMHSPCGMWL